MTPNGLVHSETWRGNAVFRAAGMDEPNLMTPKVLYRKIFDNRWAVELSQGEGLSRQPIYGVTVIEFSYYNAATRNYDGIKVRYDLCVGAFQSLNDANNYIENRYDWQQASG